MQFVKAVEASKNYQLNVYQYWASAVSAIVRAYGIVNIHTGVIEIAPVQSLADTRQFMMELEQATYGEVPGDTPITTPEPLLQ